MSSRARTPQRTLWLPLSRAARAADCQSRQLPNCQTAKAACAAAEVAERRATACACVARARQPRPSARSLVARSRSLPTHSHAQEAAKLAEAEAVRERAMIDEVVRRIMEEDASELAAKRARWGRELRSLWCIIFG
jgi:hypothetical protein